MTIYHNEKQKKVKQAYIIDISCAVCQTYLVTYQKVGRTNLVKLYYDRITKSSIDLKDVPGAIVCPNCDNIIAIKYMTKGDNKTAYRLVPSMFRKSKYIKK